MKSYKLSLVHLFLILIGSLLLGLFITFKEELKPMCKKNRSLEYCKNLQYACSCEAEKRDDYKQRLPVYRNCMKEKCCGYCINDRNKKKGKELCNPNPGSC